MIEATKRRARGRALTADDRRLTDDERDAVAANLGLVYAEAIRSALPGEPREELVQVGVIGLARAVQLYDRTRKTKLSTYAVDHIQNAIRRYRMEDRMIHVPPYLFDRCRPARPELVEAGRRASTVHSYDAPAAFRGGDGALSSASFDPIDPRPHDPADSLDAGDREWTLAALRRAVAALPDRERAVVEARMRGDKLREIGARLGVTSERARQVESHAHAMLRKAMAGCGAGDGGDRERVARRGEAAE